MRAQPPLHQQFVRLRLQITVPLDPDARIVLLSVREIYSLFSSPHEIVSRLTGGLGHYMTRIPFGQITSLRS
jgi:hypothetical protein